MKTHITGALAVLATLKAAFPLNLREKLADETWIAAEVATLEGEVADFARRTGELCGLLAALMGGISNESRSGDH